MKRIISNILLIVGLALGATAISVIVCADNLETNSNEVVSNESSSQNDYFFTVLDTPFISTGINRASSSARVQHAFSKVNFEFRFSRVACFTQLAYQKLYTTKSIYVSFYAEKRMWGYYIFALRKLLI